ncbi:alpha/beta fold hydrolase [Halorubrum sp. Ea8]|uniref:alpha/beta fold hydrolase n=1 Tax=Halorubrum sp. Ea8 TaxID=1383841 RepID=UPI000B983423|nr:alpha/beta hydrolase [Halorubrum sp. Ea8]OYR45842.1 hypothetical protein DJ74_15585 [Halorubrum sp. Ea8]
MTRSFTHGDVELAYTVYGNPSDRPLVLVHGLGADHAMWRPQCTRYPDEGYFLIVPDVRGHGESDCGEGFAIDDAAADLAALLGEVGVERATVCGVSLVGVLSQRLAIDHPDLVDALVLSDTFSGVHGAVARLNARGSEVGLSLLPGVFQWKIIESHFNAPEHEQLREYFRTMLFQTDPSVLKQARRAINRLDCRDELDLIDVPTLVLVGQENGKWFVELARETAAGIDGATFEVLAEGSDPSNLTVTPAFDDAVLTFLKNTETASG